MTHHATPALHRLAATTTLLGMLALPVQAANLLVNGGFEDSTSDVQTPTGWFNYGHTEGVLPYSALPELQVYEGLNWYTLGGHASNGWSWIGDGLGQTFATVPGATYRLSFGLTAENVWWAGSETLRVSAGDASHDYELVPTGGNPFTRPFSTEGFSFTALGTSTTLSLVLVAAAGTPGNNDPILDGLSVELVSLPVPEPASVWLMAAGLIGLLGWRRRRPAG